MLCGSKIDGNCVYLPSHICPLQWTFTVNSLEGIQTCCSEQIEFFEVTTREQKDFWKRCSVIYKMTLMINNDFHMHLRSSYDKTEIKKMNIIMLMIIIINNNHQFFQYLLSIKNLTKKFDCELTLCYKSTTIEHLRLIY